MRKSFRVILLAFVGLALLASCGRKGRVIPASKMAKIYAEIYVSDQWVVLNPKARSVIDTTRIYEPIFRKYGYTTADYRKSVDAYMENPDKYSRILKKASEIIKGEISVMQAQQLAQRGGMMGERNFFPDGVPFYVPGGAVVANAGVRVSMDSTGIYTFEVLPPDTTYSGPSVVPKASSDSVANPVDTSFHLLKKIDKRLIKEFDIPKSR